MRISHYPTMLSAFDLMLADNVASAKICKLIRARVLTLDLEPVGVFDRTEAELSNLSPDQLQDLCCGEITDRPLVTSEVDEVMTFLFEQIFI